MSKSQLTAFLAQVEADPALKLRVEAATDLNAVVVIGQESGHLFSAATLARHQRG
ncbi:Nif11-like leader peptide family natural product precursor [Synechococcus sp. CS-1325]|uniref:Nif11-like leader peptide family natural product precursor n=1 Tax=unclassified Synechococcus TaxID=2626047 RepID=UPI000DB4D2A1|nr:MULTISPECIES: Nif11-like leader peptide family natural product precursor [unclassified Synechococcus]PZU97256.1 MAG: Nif11-like leader peptide family natural product precursor [Cyanobium sp.]MCT0198377.1 Nif11-like leader peptide family natural product precursor [Synechococcus sp. CS-1325]MCT0212372.1 Nif11-like leader peptide family natural product precursor [Synechococcus sp. CS-1326]MCT0231255.1 Nif11-like leader peptide family natural product precursor [Synechococcus sp. CS-1324]MCT0234